MSGSPKYTNVYYDQQRQEELAAAARRREQERRQRIAEERQRQLAADAAQLSTRAGQLSYRVGALAQSAGALAQSAEVGRLAADIREVTAMAQNAPDEAALRRGRKDLREAERRYERLSVVVARAVAVHERKQAVDMVLSRLGAVPEREVLDRPGFARVAALAETARGAAASGKGFTGEFDKLETAAADHLTLVRDRQSALANAADTIAAADARFAALAEQAATAGAQLAEVTRVGELLAAARADITAHRASQAAAAATAAEREVGNLAEAVEAELSRLDRLSIVVKAATAALPRAGLRVIEGSLRLGADQGVSFRAERQDGTPVLVTVHAGAQETKLEYRTDGTDFVVRQQADGELKECDVTEDLLNRVGEELAKENLSTSELRWEGKSSQPRAWEALKLPTDQTRRAERQ